LLLTSTALAVFAAMNSMNTQAVGGVIPVTLVKYARNGVPERMIGSLPKITPPVKKKTYKSK